MIRVLELFGGISESLEKALVNLGIPHKSIDYVDNMTRLYKWHIIQAGRE
jgi:hypothetical protein